MHFMPDTEDEDSAAEVFWPEGYKKIIREDVSLQVRAELLKEKSFTSVYEQGYKAKFSDYSLFLDRIADMTAIGAENGADDAFDDVIDAFLKELRLPQVRLYAYYQPPVALCEEIRQKLKDNIVLEYSLDNVYLHAFKVGYVKTFSSFNEYIRQVAEIVVVGAMNGANNMLESIYRSFIRLAPVNPARRHPRRLKMW